MSSARGFARACARASILQKTFPCVLVETLGKVCTRLKQASEPFCLLQNGAGFASVSPGKPSTSIAEIPPGKSISESFNAKIIARVKAGTHLEQKRAGLGTEPSGKYIGESDGRSTVYTA